MLPSTTRFLVVPYTVPGSCDNILSPNTCASVQSGIVLATPDPSMLSPSNVLQSLITEESATASLTPAIASPTFNKSPEQ